MPKIIKLKCALKICIFCSMIYLSFFPEPGFCAENEFENLANQAARYCKQGWNLLKAGNIDSAVFNYKRAIELDPSCVAAYNDLGIVFEAKGDLEQAKEMYLKAIEVAPDYLKSYTNLALLYEKQGDYTTALLYWRRRLNLSAPEDPYLEIVEKRIESIAKIYPGATYKIEERLKEPTTQIAEPRNESIRPTINEEEARALKQEREQLYQRATLLQIEKTELEKEKSNLLQEIASLKGGKAEIEAKLSEVRNLNDQLQVKTQEINFQRQEIEQTKKDSKELNNTIERITQERLALQNENNELKGKMALVEDTLKNVNAQLETKEKELQSETQKTSGVRKDLRNLNNIIKRVSQERLALKKDNEELQQRNVLFENSLKNVNAQIQAKTQELFNKAQESEKLKSIIQELNNKLESAKQESFQLKDELKTKIQDYYVEKQKFIEESEKETKVKVERLNREILNLKKENEIIQEKAVLNEGLPRQIERLKNDNANLITEITKLNHFNAQLETKAKEFYIKSQENEEAKNDFNNLNNLVERMNQKCLMLKKENEILRQETFLFEDTLRNERVKLYEELGTAYAKAKLFNLGIQAYEKALKFNPQNADVHYNLGLLYKHYRDNNKKALFHLKKYLQLKSNAPNKKEVEYLIGMLGEKKF